MSISSLDKPISPPDLSWLDPTQLINIIETASQLILQIYIGNDFLVENKEDNSPLTIADKRANDYICSNLQTLYPHIPIISEESKNALYDQRQHYTFAWLIDPLDGTKEFIKKNGEFTVNIGLIYNSSPVAGFVNIPVQGLTYWAIQGQGAHIQNISTNESQEIRELRNKNVPKNKRKARVLASRSHSNPQTEEFIKRLGEVELLNVGSSIKILWVAENKADIYPRLQGSMEWDTCAAHAILKEIGGTIQKYENQEILEEIIYNKPDLTNPYFICACPFFFITPK